MAGIAPGRLTSLVMNDIVNNEKMVRLHSRKSRRLNVGGRWLCCILHCQRKRTTTITAAAASDSDAKKESHQTNLSKDAGAVKSDSYNQAMQSKMRNPYEYHHDLGMNYTLIENNLIVGSQPQCNEDVTRLHKDEGVKSILNLQQDKDVEYWGIDLAAVMNQCSVHKINYFRIPARDFDPNSLRKELPRAVAALEGAIAKGPVYVHCTAGLGRSPAVAIAYLFWFCNMDMNTAYQLLTSKRPCGPKKEAIRGATYDLVNTDMNKLPLEKLPDDAFSDVSPVERTLIQERVRKLRSK